MYVRETSDGLYSPLTYLLYKVPMLTEECAQRSHACLPAPWLHACGTQDLLHNLVHDTAPCITKIIFP